MTPNPIDYDDPEIKLMVEAARRATWNALYGPHYLRDGRYRYGRNDIADPREAKAQAEADERDRLGDAESGRR